MSRNKLIEFFEELDETNEGAAAALPKGLSQKRESKKQVNDARLFVRAQEFSREFQFTYKAARFEEAWLLDSLIEIAQHQWIADVLRKVKGGKEASVYLCRSGTAVPEPLVAAKVYRPRSLRNLKNDQQYRVGRVDLDADGNALVKSGDVHAIQKRTSYGETLRHQSWIAYEFRTLELLHQAGVDVPKPYALERNSILMGYVGGPDAAAPALVSVALEPQEARRLYERTVYNIDLMLKHNCIHGDLSAYNILYWNGGITLIDFPQVVPPESNPAAWTIFKRDVTRVCQYFADQGVDCDGGRLAADLWTAHGHRLVAEPDPKYLDADLPEDRQDWERRR